MDATLWIELGENRCTFAIEDTKHMTFQYVDFSGGYGMTQVPFKIAYLEDEDDILCGEEAENFGRAIWAGESVESTGDFLRKCIGKIKQQYHDYRIRNIVLINAINFTKQICKAIEEILWVKEQVKIVWTTLKEAFVGFGYHNQISEGTLLYFNGSWTGQLYFRLEDVMNQRSSQINYIQICLDGLDQYYLNELIEKHRLLYGKSIDIEEVKRTYEEQKLLLYRQIQLKKDVHLYTSIQYPPQKISFSYDAFQTFFNQWIQENVGKIPIQSEHIWVGGGYNKESYWKQLLAKSSYQYDEHMLIKGAKAFLAYKEANGKELSTKTITHWGYAVVDGDNNRIPFILPGEEYKETYGIDLFLTNFERNVPFLYLDQDMNEKHLFNLYFHPKNENTHIQMTMTIDSDGQIEEVKYEYRPC